MSENVFEVSLPQLRRACELLLRHVEQTAGEVVALDKDLFWSIDPKQLYDPYQEPSELTMGQLAESLQHLTELTHGETEPLAYQLVWLADVLRAIGHHTTG